MLKVAIQYLILLLMLLNSTGTYSQDKGLSYPGKARCSLAVFAGGYGYDSGIGVEIGSPAFSNNRLSVRLRGSTSWLEQYKAAYDHWAQYKTVNASIVYNFTSIERCRTFVEAGPFVVFPDKRFSSETSFQGLTASAGVEMFVLSS